MNARDMLQSGEVQRLLRQWLGAGLTVDDAPADSAVEVHARFADVELIVAIARNDVISRLATAALRLDHAIGNRPRALPVVAVPYMGPKARAFLRDRGMSWMDLSGNADIRGHGIRVLVEGRPNRFVTPGRPSTVFSPKASRLSRVMLVEPERAWLQNELAAATDLSNGFVSKVIRRMEADHLVERDGESGRVRPASPDLLLDTWGQAHAFERQSIHRFHAIGRTGPAVLQTLGERLTAIRWAATGLAAAWQQSHFADFRLATIYVSAALLRPESLGLRPVDRGENVWLVVPKDDGVFYGATELDGIPCVHPVQCYLDLLGHPERAREAAAELRAHHLPWSRT